MRVTFAIAMLLAVIPESVSAGEIHATKSVMGRASQPVVCVKTECSNGEKWSAHNCSCCAIKAHECDQSTHFWSNHACQCIEKPKECPEDKKYSFARQECLCKPVPCQYPKKFNSEACACVVPSHLQKTIHEMFGTSSAAMASKPLLSQQC